MYEDSIAAEAHGLVHGTRASTYGHPRKDFKIIAKVWTGLLQDLLEEGAELDEYRVAVMMTGLKLARLVKSPGHHDSRVDTIGYMLTMERLDEPTDEELARADAAAALADGIDDAEELTCQGAGVQSQDDVDELEAVKGHQLDNPTDLAVSMAKDILERRARFYDQEAKVTLTGAPPNEVAEALRVMRGLNGP